MNLNSEFFPPKNFIPPSEKERNGKTECQRFTNNNKTKEWHETLAKNVKRLPAGKKYIVL